MKIKILLIVLIAISFQIINSPVFAIRAYREPINITQPDGTQLTIRLQGDEFHHYQTTEDGYLLKSNVKGYLTYATINAAGQTIESEFIARNISKRSATEIQFLKTAPKHETIQSVQNTRQKSKMLSAQSVPQRAYPLTGSPKSLVILVNFSDKSYVTSSPQTAYTNLLNQPNYSTNGGTGSARDYFKSCSYGKFSPNFDVVGPYTLPNTMAFYGANDTSGNDTNPQQMVIDACSAANTAGLDFTKYDTDNDGYVDNIFVYYAGYNEAEGGPANSVWPHRWTLANTSTKFDGKIIYDYSCTSELQGSTGSSMCGIGTFCHEFGHVLGLPDYYDTSGAQTNTLNSWDIMDYGAYSNAGRTPPTYSVYDRFFLGYIAPEQVSTASDLTLLPIYQDTIQPAKTNNQAFLFSATTHNLIGSNPSPTEFFMVEYRKKTGWDTYLPAEGMLIWHIDYNQTAWNDNVPNNYSGTTQTATSHMRVYLQPLSGLTTTPGTAFTSGSYAPTTWAGTNINRAITSITKSASNITFKLMGGAPDLTPKITMAGTVIPFQTTVGTSSTTQNLTLTGTYLTGNLLVNLADSTNFYIKLSTESTWSKSISIVPTLGSVNVTLNILYNPTTVGTHTNQVKFTSTGATDAYLSLSGTAAPDPNAPTIITGRIENLLQFPTTRLNAISTKTLNIKTTDLIGDLALAITGNDASYFTATVSSITKDAANATNGVNISINYTPTSPGAHTATLTISGGGLTPDRVISLNGTGL